MNKIYKKYLILTILLLFINIPILVICTVRTNSYITLKGDTNTFDSVVEIDTDYKEKGSFSTVSVVSANHTTIFQNLLGKLVPHAEMGEISSGSSHLSDMESYRAGKIQYETSIKKSIILAYNEAKKKDASINISYKRDGYFITYYEKGSELQIGDKFIENGNLNIDALIDGAYILVGDEDIETKVLRDGREVAVTLKSGEALSGYHDYNIAMDTLSPSARIIPNRTGGPSGGLLQTLSIYNRITEEDITHGFKIAGTGTIEMDGRVGPIGGIKEKIPTAFDDEVDIFFCAALNYEDALEAYNKIPNKEKMKLIRIETFYDALNYLLEGYKNDF